MVLHTHHNVLLPPLSGRTGRVFAAFIRSRRIPQALLLTGINGIGKSAVATQLALAFNCEEPPRLPVAPEAMDHWSCGKCPSCLTIGSQNHPDILAIAPQNDQIHIETIRTLITQLGFTPYSAIYRFVVIRRAEKMTSSAGNALLKILEEPPPQTHFILTTDRASDLLPTILSRCQILRFQPWPDDVIISHLMDQHNLDPSTATETVKLAAGSPIKASELAINKWFTTQKWAMDALDRVNTLSARQRLVLAQRLAQKKTDLETLLFWFKTVILERLKKETANATPQRTTRQTRKDVQRLIQRYEWVEMTRFYVTTNANRRMVLERMLQGLATDSAPLTLQEY